MPARSRRPPPIGRKSGDSFDQATKLQILIRDGYVCQLCGVRLTTHDPKLSTHAVAGHVVAHQDGGLPTLANGRAECARCSASMGAAQGNIKAKRDWIEINERLRQAQAEAERLRNIVATQQISVEPPVFFDGPPTGE